VMDWRPIEGNCESSLRREFFFGEGEIRRTREEKVKIHSKKKTKEKKFQDQ